MMLSVFEKDIMATKRGKTMIKTVKKNKNTGKVVKQLPIARWLFEIGILLVSYVLHYVIARHSYIWGAPYVVLFSLLFMVACGAVFCILMRPAMLKPKSHKFAWIAWGMWVLYVLCCGNLGAMLSSFNHGYLLSGMHSLRNIWAFLTLFPVAIIWLFMDRSENNQENASMKQKKSICVMIFSSVFYMFVVLIWGVHGTDLDMIVPLSLCPLYMISLCVWLYRGWGKRGCLLGLLLSLLIFACLLGVFFL